VGIKGKENQKINAKSKNRFLKGAKRSKGEGNSRPRENLFRGGKERGRGENSHLVKQRGDELMDGKLGRGGEGGVLNFLKPVLSPYKEGEKKEIEKGEKKK